MAKDKEIKDLSDLRQDESNARKHTPRNVGMIENSLRQIGAARSGVIDENGRILAGNGTYEALSAAGIRRVKVVDADGEEWVVVRRKGLTEEQKRILSISDNRAAELAEWDAPALEGQGIHLAPWFQPWELERVGIEQESNSVNEHWRGMPECENQDLTAWKSIKVNFNSKESLQAFSKIIGQPLTENTRSIWYPPAEIGRYADKKYEGES